MERNLTVRIGMNNSRALPTPTQGRWKAGGGISLHFMFYDFAGPQTISRPLDAVSGSPLPLLLGAADHIWSVWEIAALLD